MHSSILAWKVLWTEGPGSWSCKELDMTEQLSTHFIKHVNMFNKLFVCLIYFIFFLLDGSFLQFSLLE